MKSHLTRRVFRSILANEPIVHRGCLRRRAFGTARASIDRRNGTSYQRSGPPMVCPPQRRTFFDLGMFGKKREVKEPDIDPGLDVMQDLERFKRMRARLPSPDDVADAVMRFFAAKSRRKQALTDTQARLSTESIKYCLDAGIETEAHQSMLREPLLKQARDILAKNLAQSTRNHVALAELFVDIVSNHGGKTFYIQPMRAYALALTHTGRSLEARDLVRRLTSRTDTSNQAADSADMRIGAVDGGEESPAVLMPRLWHIVMVGLSREGKGEELHATLEEIKAHQYNEARVAWPAMLDYYLQGDDAQKVQEWFWKFWRSLKKSDVPGRPRQKHSAVERTVVRLRRVLSWCLQHNHLALGHEIVREVMAKSPPKLYWDAVLVWAAGTGKGADEISRMLGVMEASSGSTTGSDRKAIPDIDTINGLVEFAIAKNDPYLAERFISIGKQRNIHPDARTYVLQMQYRLKVKDIDGALVAYTNLQSMDISDNNDVPTVNDLIVALCNSRRHDFDTVMNVAADLSDRRVRFEPSTVSALALLHLNRDEVADVVDLLNTHANHYSSQERISIKNAIFDFCVNPATPTSRAWDGYTILRSVFDEMPRSQRTELMVSFFNRERPDMATHIFSSMRTHSRADTLPTVDTYVAAFLACAKLRDLDVLEVIHNQLKLDYNIDLTTYLYNALMISYTAAGKPRRALEFWDDIVASKEGPTYNSIHIALRACEKAPFGDLKAQEIWKRLRRTNVDLDQSLWSSYAGALVGNGDMNLAISTIEEAEANDEVEVDAYLVGSLLNACPGQAKQDEVEAWTKERRPHVWTELEKLGITSDESGMRTVKIDRTVTP